MVPVLLLNASFEPLGVISWHRAISLFFAGKVEVITEYDHHIRTVSIAIKAPSVVRLLRYARVPRRFPALTRTNILARDNFACQYCERALCSKTATLDHVVPRSQGGKTSWDNLVSCCVRCNRRKGARTPAQANMKLLVQPSRPDWLPVLTFRLNGDVPLSWKLFFRSQ